jgi:hypothetical protein
VRVKDIYVSPVLLKHWKIMVMRMTNFEMRIQYERDFYRLIEEYAPAWW